MGGGSSWGWKEYVSAIVPAGIGKAIVFVAELFGAYMNDQGKMKLANTPMRMAGISNGSFPYYEVPYNEMSETDIDIRVTDIDPEGKKTTMVLYDGENVTMTLLITWGGTLLPQVIVLVSNTDMTFTYSSLGLTEFGRPLFSIPLGPQVLTFDVEMIQGSYIPFHVALTRSLQESTINDDPSTSEGNKLPVVQFLCTSDAYGCNLGEMTLNLKSNTQYIPGYPLELVGYCDNVDFVELDTKPISQLYSAKPDVDSVLIDDGKTFTSLLAHVKYLNEKYPSGYDTCTFFNKILEYSTAKYFFMGLLNGHMDLKWLRRSYQAQFLTQMENSEFSKYLKYFTDPQYGYVGMETYFVC